MNERANLLYEEQLVRKGLRAFAFSIEHKKVSSEKARQAVLFARHQLRKKAFDRLVVGMCVIRDLKGKRESLFHAVNKWANHMTVKTIFRKFHLATKISPKDLADKGLMVEQARFARLFRAWNQVRHDNRNLHQIS